MENAPNDSKSDPVVEHVATPIVPSPPTAKTAIGFRDFRLYLAMRLPSNLATQMQSVAVGYQVYEITRKPLDLGLVGLAQFLPVFGLALVAGHVADHFDRRKILMICMTVSLLCSAMLAFFAFHGLSQVWPIYAVIALFGAARAFAAPANQSLMPNTVPVSHLGNAFAWSSSGFQVSMVAGPALGGLLYAFGPQAVYSVAGLLFLVAILSVAVIRIRATKVERRALSWETLLAGIHFIRARREILGAISLDLFAVLFGGATALLPIYARDILEIGPVGLGILRSAPAAGATVVGILLTRWSLGRHTGRLMFSSVALFGVAVLVFGISRSVPLSLAALFVLGAADMVSVFVRQNLVQRATPDNMRGRVSAVASVFIVASNELGEMESGLAAAAFGTVEAVILGGLGTLAVVGLWIWRFPELVRVDRLEDVKPD